MSDSKEDISAGETGHNIGYDNKNDVHQAPLHFPTKDELNHTKSMNEVIHNAKTATDKEHKMTLWQGIKLYPKAVGWSLLISTCICMEGYDVCLLSNFCESPAQTIVPFEYF
jgi:SP family general alpha glucoside:H+ symporter-like MFS transporter